MRNGGSIEEVMRLFADRFIGGEAEVQYEVRTALPSKFELQELSLTAFPGTPQAELTEIKE